MVGLHADRSDDRVTLRQRGHALDLVINALGIDGFQRRALDDVHAVEHEQVAQHELIHGRQLGRAQELAPGEQRDGVAVLHQVQRQFAGDESRADDDDRLAGFRLAIEHVERADHIVSVRTGQCQRSGRAALGDEYRLRLERIEQRLIRACIQTHVHAQMRKRGGIPGNKITIRLLEVRHTGRFERAAEGAYLYKELKGACPLKEEVADAGFDMIIVRELTGGLYFGERKTEEVDGVLTATDTLTYNENEIRRIAKKAFEIAMKRRKNVIGVDKSNVLDSSRLWDKVVNEVAKDYPEVTLTHMLVDNCAMQLVKDPAQFDVVVTENMFGDILSDEASMITGSIGMLSSASLREDKFGLYEPSHGAAPDIAGQNKANPIATILSAAMMLRYSFDLDKEADAVEKAVEKVLEDNIRTVDIMSDGMTLVGCKEMGDEIVNRL